MLGNLHLASSMKKSLTEERQADSVKRLTLLAAIFLPLSLASSLLSMGSRAKELGLLWYDYIGLCAVLFFVVITVYQGMYVLDLYQAIGATQTIRLFHRMRQRGNSYESVVKWVLLQFRRTRRSDFSKWKVAEWTLNSTFMAATVASFVVGMWKVVGLGLKIWGFSAAAWLGTSLIVSVLRIIITLRLNI